MKLLNYMGLLLAAVSATAGIVFVLFPVYGQNTMLYVFLAGIGLLAGLVLFSLTYKNIDDEEDLSE